MSAGTIVTIGGHEVYYAGRPRSPLGQEPLSDSLKSHTTRPQPAAHPLAIPTAVWPFSAVLAAGLLVLLAIILVRHTRRPS